MLALGLSMVTGTCTSEVPVGTLKLLIETLAIGGYFLPPS